MQGIFSSSRANRLRLVLPSFPTFHRDDAKINPFSANQFERIIDLDDMIEAELIDAPDRVRFTIVRQLHAIRQCRKQLFTVE